MLIEIYFEFTITRDKTAKKEFTGSRFGMITHAYTLELLKESIDAYINTYTGFMKRMDVTADT